MVINYYDFQNSIKFMHRIGVFKEADGWAQDGGAESAAALDLLQNKELLPQVRHAPEACFT